jgi:hypothetical protein
MSYVMQEDTGDQPCGAFISKREAVSREQEMICEIAAQQKQNTVASTHVTLVHLTHRQQRQMAALMTMHATTLIVYCVMLKQSILFIPCSKNCLLPKHSVRKQFMPFFMLKCHS